MAGDPGKLYSQPYDKIPDALRDEYHARSPYNFARIIKGRSREGDDETDNCYTRAARDLDGWLAEGVLARDPEPCLYVYHQTTEAPGKVPMRRKAFVAAAELEDFGAGVRPHESTHAGPKANRLNLARATGSHTGPIFMLYDEPDGRVNAALDEAISGREPDVRVADDFGSLHELWAVSDRAVIARAAEIMAGAPCLIADGHHRYETALNYRNEMRRKGRACAGADSFENALVAFVNLHDPALVIYPSHRVVFDVEPGRIEALLDEASGRFAIQEAPIRQDLKREEALADLSEALTEAGKNANAVCLYRGEGDLAYFLTLRDPSAFRETWAAGRSDAWRSLDVAVLYALLLEPILGITAADLEHERKVRYARHADEAVGEVDRGEAQFCFLLNPTRVSQVRDVAFAGEKMPQKSTDFFPKLLSGLVFLKIVCEG